MQYSERSEAIHSLLSAGDLFTERVPREGIHLSIGPGCTIFDDASLLMRLYLTAGKNPARTRTIIMDPQDRPKEQDAQQFIYGEGNVTLHRGQMKILRTVGLPLAQEEYAGESYGCFNVPDHLAGKVRSISDHNTLAFLIKTSSGILHQPPHMIRTFALGLENYRSLLMHGGVLYMQCREEPYFIDTQTDKKVPYTRLLLNSGFNHVEEFKVDDIWEVPFDDKILTRFYDAGEPDDAAGYSLYRKLDEFVTNQTLQILPQYGRFHHGSPHLIIATA